MSLDEIKKFIENNSDLIYRYINEDILKDIGVMNSNYFSQMTQNVILEKTNYTLEKKHLNLNILPYALLTKIEGVGKMDYTSLRNETINFEQIDKEASVYYNYAKFTLEKEFLSISLMQTKIGGMPIDKDIVKFIKKIPLKHKGLELFSTK